MTKVAEPTARCKTAPDHVALERDFNAIDLEGHPTDAFEEGMAALRVRPAPLKFRISEACADPHLLRAGGDPELRDGRTVFGRIVIFVAEPALRHRAQSFRVRAGASSRQFLQRLLVKFVGLAIQNVPVG